jgi:hypothetical protein
MKNVWMAQLDHVTKVLLGMPASQGEYVIYAVVVFLSFVIVFNKLSRLLNYPLSALGLSVLVCVLSGIAAVAGGVLLSRVATMADTGFLEDLPFDLAVFVGAVLGLVLLAAPLLRVTNRSRYGANVLGLLLSSAATAVVLALVIAITDAARSGDKELDSTRNRTRSVNEFLNE